MTVAILATGDEIVDGDTLNTNARAIALALGSERIPVGMHLSCRDRQKDLVEALDFLSQRYNYIILIGGLGPTCDDLTRFALAEFLNSPLVEDATAIRHIEMRLQRAALQMTPSNRQQALFPEKTQILDNPHGTALGGKVVCSSKVFFLLPGPPVECLPMFRDYVLPDLAYLQDTNKILLKWRLFGVAESVISSQLAEGLQGIDCELAYRLERPYLEFKVRCLHADRDEIENRVHAMIEPFLIATPQEKASERLRAFLQYSSFQGQLLILDRATGGYFEFLLHRPGLAQFLYFDEDQLPNRDEWIMNGGRIFKIYGLDEYWSQKSLGGKTKIHMEYRHGKTVLAETHDVPYYNEELVLEYAVEYLSFRLFHLINQLHEGEN